MKSKQNVIIGIGILSVILCFGCQKQNLGNVEIDSTISGHLRGLHSMIEMLQDSARLKALFHSNQTPKSIWQLYYGKLEGSDRAAGLIHEFLALADYQGFIEGVSLEFSPFQGRYWFRLVELNAHGVKYSEQEGKGFAICAFPDPKNKEEIKSYTYLIEENGMVWRKQTNGIGPIIQIPSNLKAEEWEPHF